MSVVVDYITTMCIVIRSLGEFLNHSENERCSQLAIRLLWQALNSSSASPPSTSMCWFMCRYEPGFRATILLLESTLLGHGKRCTSLQAAIGVMKQVWMRKSSIFVDPHHVSSDTLGFARSVLSRLQGAIIPRPMKVVGLQTTVGVNDESASAIQAVEDVSSLPQAVVVEDASSVPHAVIVDDASSLPQAVIVVEDGSRLPQAVCSVGDVSRQACEAEPYLVSDDDDASDDLLQRHLEEELKVDEDTEMPALIFSNS